MSAAPELNEFIAWLEDNEFVTKPNSREMLHKLVDDFYNEIIRTKGNGA